MDKAKTLVLDYENYKTPEQIEEDRLCDCLGRIITMLDENRQESRHIENVRREQHGINDIMAVYHSGMAAAFDVAIVWLERALDNEK